MKRILYTVTGILLCKFSFAQQPEIETLYKSLSLTRDSIAHINILNRLATIYYLKNADSCYYYAHKAYIKSEKYNYTIGMADALNNIGIYYSLKTNTFLATRYYNESLDLYRRIKDTANESQLLMNLGIEFALNNKNHEALKYLYGAYDLSKKVRYDSIRSLAICNILIFDKHIKKDSFNLLLNEGLAVAKKYKDSRMEIALEQNKAQMYIDAGNIDAAINVLKAIEPEAGKLALQYELIAVYNLMGAAYLHKDTAKAINYYKLAMANAKSNGYTDVYLITAQNLYSLFKNRNDINSAGTYADILVSAAKESQRFLQESGVNYLDYLVTHKALVIEKEKNKERSILNIVLIILVLSVIAMLLISFRGYKSSKRYSASLQHLNNMIYKKNKQLEQNNEFKDKLISLLAHDFRQPLVSLSSLVSLLKDHEKLSTEEIDRVLESIENSSKSSVDIFENILQWIKKQLSGFVYVPASFNLKELLAEAIDIYAFQMKEKNIRFINSIDGLLNIHADREMLQFINRNLVHNAIKFSNANNEIHISAVHTKEETIVAIRDFGTGMTEEKVNNLFSFFSAKTYSNNAEKGAGVALVICKDFIDKMHGRLWAKSEKDNGTTFYFALPVINNLV